MTQSRRDKKFSSLLDQCDSLIKLGQSNKVAALTSDLNLSQVPRSIRAQLAKICRRAGLVGQGLRLLQPIIRAEKADSEPATPDEICEYAVLLSRNGSMSEAFHLLKSIDSEKCPEAMLYLGYCYISTWDYGNAIPLLEKFLQTPGDRYTQLIASVNLAASYLADYRLKETEELLNEIIPSARLAGASRLVGNGLDILGHLYFQKGDYPRARETLAQALQFFADHQSYDRLLINKTLSIIDGFEQCSRVPLEKFRTEAMNNRHWESVREIDLYRAKIQYDQKMVDHLLFGTPMPSFRQRLRRELGGGQMSENYILGSGKKTVLDLETGTLDGLKVLNPGKKIHQTLAALVKDFYVPRSFGSLFAELYPDEYFDINSSQHRVQQLLSRTRRWLEQNDIPAGPETENGQLRFLIHGDFGIRFSSKRTDISPFLIRWGQLKEKFLSEKQFTSSQAREVLGWPHSKFLRVVDEAMKAGQLKKLGSGRQTVYQIVDEVLEPASNQKIA